MQALSFSDRGEPGTGGQKGDQGAPGAPGIDGKSIIGITIFLIIEFIRVPFLLFRSARYIFNSSIDRKCQVFSSV